MLMKWIDDLSRKIVQLSGQKGDAGDIIGLVSSFVIFGVVALLLITIVSIVTGISTSVLWTVAMIASIAYSLRNYFR